MEAITLVCDVCHAPATATARITVNAKNHLKDLCSTHLAELLKGSRTPRRGRPRTGAPSATGRTATTRKKASTGRRKPAKRTARKRTSRAKRASSAS